MKLSDCLVGPLQDQELDRCLKSGFPDLHFFEGNDSLEALIEQLKPQAILVLEPLQRLIPIGVWQSNLPLIGLGSKAAVFWPELYQRVLRAFQAYICLDDAIRALLPPELPVAATTVLPFLIPPQATQHQPRARLFKQALVLDRPWSAGLARLTAEPFAFFIHTSEQRLPFYLEHAQAVYLSPLYLNKLPFKAALAGAEVFLNYNASTENSAFDDLIELGNASAKPAQSLQFNKLKPLSELGAWDLRQSLPQALLELESLGLKPAIETALICQYQQALFADQPNGLVQLQSARQNKQLEHHPEIRMALFLRLSQHPQIQVNQEQLRLQTQDTLSNMAAGLLKQVFELQLMLWEQSWQAALDLTAALLQTDLNRLVEAVLLPWIYDPIFIEIAEVYPLERVATIWLKFQQIYCWVHLSAFAEAQTHINDLIQTHYFPAISSLLLSLEPHYPQINQQIIAAFEHDPLNMPLAQQALKYRGQIAQTQAEKQTLLDHCRHYQKLARQHMTQSHELAGFMALERELCCIEVNPNQPPYILWEGALQSFSSLAQINRHWCQHLSQDTYRLTNIPYHPPEIEPDPLSLELQTIYLQSPDIVISHRWPPRLEAPVAGKWAAIIPWEMGSIPVQWVEQINRVMDQVWVPSEFVARSFYQSGVQTKKVRVLPNGVDCQLFQPEGERYPLETNKSFRFLFVGGTVYRKGVDLLLKAFRESFTADDDVVLVIKSFGSKSHYANQSNLETIQTEHEPEILIIEDDLTPEQLASLYRSCDVYVHPYRGEGFGMPILEAMASGLPVIIPDSGPAPEFCPLACSWQVPGRVVFQSAADMNPLGQFKFQPYLFEIDSDALCQRLVEAKNNQTERLFKAAQARKLSLAYDWHALYPILRQQVQSLISQPLTFRQNPQTFESVNQMVKAIQQKPTIQEIPWLDWLQQTTDLDPFYQVAAQHSAASDRQLIWRLALVAGLTLKLAKHEYTRLYQRQVNLPLRVQWHLDPIIDLPIAEKSPYFIRQTQAEFADLVISTDAANTDIIYLLHGSIQASDLPTFPSKNPAQLPLIWAQTDTQVQALHQLGWPETAVLCLPLGLDFTHYGPHIRPKILDESIDRFSFLAILDWADRSAWQDLLWAYADAFGSEDRVNLVLKICDQPLDAVLPELMQWLETQGLDPEGFPEMTLLQEDLAIELLPGLFRGVQVYLDSSRRGSGLWPLIAQASEIPVISCSPLPHVQSPYASRYQTRQQLSGYLQYLKQNQKLIDTPLIKNELAQNYDQAQWQSRFSDQLLRSYLLLQTSESALC